MGAVGFDFKDWARSTLGVQIISNSNQSRGPKGPDNKSTPDALGEEELCHGVHMGREHASREKKLPMVIFFIFVHENVYRIRFQEIKIRP